MVCNCKTANTKFELFNFGNEQQRSKSDLKGRIERSLDDEVELYEDEDKQPVWASGYSFFLNVDSGISFTKFTEKTKEFAAIQFTIQE